MWPAILIFNNINLQYYGVNFFFLFLDQNILLHNTTHRYQALYQISES